MARTAPVPNIPPIPGMCPSIAVMGGGGDGGGGSGNGAGNGDGNGPGDGSGNGDGANGDGSGAGSCGQGTGGGCSNCHPGTAAGHPVDVVTGRAYTNPAHDLFLPGPLELWFTRRYSTSARKRDLGLGYGWCHSFSWRVWVRRAHIEVLTDDGRVVHFQLLEPGETATSVGGWRLRLDAGNFTLDATDGVMRTFVPAASSTTTYLLSSCADVNGNTIQLVYDRDLLTRIVDCVGRNIRFENTPEGRIRTLSVMNAVTQGQWVTFATYTYDDEGDLIGVVDADGNASGYAYEEHLLTLEREATGLTFHFVYDAERRCIETWGDYPGREDPSLASSVPELLADGTTRAKGVHHVRIVFGDDGGSEVADSIQVRRFFGNRFGLVDKAVDQGGVTTRKYDDFGRPISRTDALGGVTSYQWDTQGRPMRLSEPSGRSYAFGYDGSGRLISAKDAAGGLWTLTRDSRGNILTVSNPRNAVWGTRYDARGLPTFKSFPTGGMEHRRYDGHGNLVEWVDANSGRWRFEYDFFGRLTTRTDPTGATMRVIHSPGGRPMRTIDALGGESFYQWDGVGQLIQLVDVDGGVIRHEWGGYRCRTATIYPNGDVVAERYDREGHRIEVHNELGEVSYTKVDARGRKVSEQTFDGRVLSYRYDKVGQLVEISDAAGRRTKYAYAMGGDLSEVTFGDGTSESYGYSQRGDLAFVEGAGYRLDFVRDEVGNVVEEIQTVGDSVERVASRFDLADLQVERTTSRGHSLLLERDAIGFVARATLDAIEQISFVRDAAGSEIQKSFGGGGTVHSQVDGMNQLRRRWVEVAGASAGAGATPFDCRYSYTSDGEIASRWDGRRGSTAYEYDPRKRLLSSVSQNGLAEKYRYDKASNVYEEGGPARSYGAGNVLETRGDATFVWDKDGRLSEKRIRQSDGSDDVWSYEWTARGHLRAVNRPDKSRVEFQYDAFGRRLQKRVLTRGRSGKHAASGSTRFVWDKGTLVHEIRARAAAAGDAIVSERTYWVQGGEVPEPLAQRDKVADPNTQELQEGPWLHYVNDVTGMPEQLVTSSGQTVAELDRTAWGRVLPSAKQGRTSTPLRFSGQYEDEETGLYYNRHRYYDPDLGRYISPDPIGLDGGINVFRYSKNPISSVDPLGLIWRDGVWVNTAQATFSPPPGTRPGRLMRNPHGPPDSPVPYRWENEGNGGRHTEGRIMDHLRSRPDHETRGGTLAITGDFHACQNCRNEMEAFARERGMRVEYCGNNGENRGRDPRLFTVDHRPGASPSGLIHPG